MDRKGKSRSIVRESLEPTELILKLGLLWIRNALISKVNVTLGRMSTGFFSANLETHQPNLISKVNITLILVTVVLF